MPDEPYNPSPIGNPSVLARRNWWQTKLVIFIGKHTPKCNEMVRILSKSLDEPLPLTMRIKKRIHFLICCWCQRYEEQLHYLRHVSRSFPEHADQAAMTVPVSSAAKERWKNALRTAPALSGAEFDVNGEASETWAATSWRASRPNRTSRAPWNLLITALALLLLFFGIRFGWRPSSSRSITDFRDEMVSFIGVSPKLDYESPKLSALNEWLRTSGRPANFPIPQNLTNHSTVGCRLLRFHDRDVTLICFRRDQGGLIHLFVVDGSAIGGLPDRQHPDIAQEGEWMTAAWTDTNHDYLLAVQGDRAAIRTLLPDR